MYSKDAYEDQIDRGSKEYKKYRLCYNQGRAEHRQLRESNMVVKVYRQFSEFIKNAVSTTLTDMYAAGFYPYPSERQSGILVKTCIDEPL